MTFWRRWFGGGARGYGGPLEELTVRTNPDEGWGGDVSLRIVAIERDGDRRVLTAKALADGAPVGLRVAVPARFVAGVTFGSDGDIKIHGAHLDVVFASIGAESDALLRAIARLWGHAMDAPFEREVAVYGLSLDQHAFDADAADGTAHIKLFFEHEGEVDDEIEEPPPGTRTYAELYLNLDLGNLIVELAEKDEGYRDSLLAHWSRSAGGPR